MRRSSNAKAKWKIVLYMYNIHMNFFHNEDSSDKSSAYHHYLYDNKFNTMWHIKQFVLGQNSPCLHEVLSNGILWCPLMVIQC